MKDPEKTVGGLFSKRTVMDKNLDIQVEEALKDYWTSGVEDQVDYQKFYLYSIVTHSTAIEGSTVTEIENQLLFDEGIAAKGRSLTELMMKQVRKSTKESKSIEKAL